MRRQNEPVAAVSSESAQKHLALIYLIRAGEAFIMVPILLVVLLIGFGIIFGADHFLVFIVLVSFLLVGAWRIAKEPDRFSKIFRPFQEMKAKFQHVNANNIGNFAFIFAAFAAHDVYQLMPAKPFKVDPGTSGLLMSFLHRDSLWIFVFLGLWIYLKALLGRLLELNSPAPSENSSPDNPDIPEFPQKSPLLPL